MQVNHNVQKKIALINDLSGFGRCSITVQLPIISALHIQCCPVPTAILSNHTAYDSYFIKDFTDEIPAYIQEWKKLNLTFNGILSGFLGSEKQIDMVLEIIKDFSQKDTITVIDPVMADDGKAYPTYTPSMCSKMKDLVKRADICTPNITEACILTDTKYKKNWNEGELEDLCKKIARLGPDKIVISGIEHAAYIENACYEKGKSFVIIKEDKVGSTRCGTGDIFSAIIAADAVNGVDFDVSVKKASHFISKCLQISDEMKVPMFDGVAFEELMNGLK